MKFRYLLISLIFLLFSCNLENAKFSYLIKQKEYSLFIKKAYNTLAKKIDKNDFSYSVLNKIQDFEPNEKNALLVACFLGDVKLIKKLITLVHNLNYKDDEGYLPLTYTIFSKNTEAFEYILNYSSKDTLNAKTDYNSNLLQISASVGNFDIFLKLLDLNMFDLNYKNYMQDNALNLASYYGNIDIVKKIIAMSQDSVINEKNRHGYTPFLYSIQSKNIDLIDYLYSLNSVRNIKDTNIFGDNYYLIACKVGDVEVINYFITVLGIEDYNYQNFEGQTCAMILSAQGNDDVFSLLVSKQIDYKIKDKQGKDISYYLSISKNKIIKSMISI